MAEGLNVGYNRRRNDHKLGSSTFNWLLKWRAGRRLPVWSRRIYRKTDPAEASVGILVLAVMTKWKFRVGRRLQQAQ